MKSDDGRRGGGAPIRLKDIARELGVSTGTVARGLNGKPGISPVTRARVLAFAERAGYAPNLAARVLQSCRPLRVAVHVPDEGAFFWDALRDGIREAAAPFAPGLQLDFRIGAGAGEGEVSLLDRALADGIDGLIVAPRDPASFAPQLAAAARRSVPLVCVGRDAPTSPHALWVTVDPFIVGAVAGELLARFLPGPGEVALFTGGLGRQDHADTLRGFVTRLSAVNRALMLTSIVEAHDDEQEAARRTTALLRARPGLNGLCIATSHASPVLRAAEREGRLAGLTVIATDLVPDLVDWIRAGKVAATIDQRSRSQGQVALVSLYQILQNRDHPPVTQYISPGIVLGSNLDLPCP